MSGAGGGAAANKNKETRKRVLVVDDDPQIRNLVARALSTTYTVTEASDGLKAAEALGLPPLPDLIILDIMMPNVDGLTLAGRLKANPDLKAVPILFLTAKSMPTDLIRGIQAGARAYVTKPFKLDELRQQVAKILG
jgi:CheY-like chemotaxis protein